MSDYHLDREVAINLELLRMSIELTECSPELQAFVKRLHLLSLQRLAADLREDQRNLDASLPALLRPQA